MKLKKNNFFFNLNFWWKFFIVCCTPFFQFFVLFLKKSFIIIFISLSFILLTFFFIFILFQEELFLGQLLFLSFSFRKLFLVLFISFQFILFLNLPSFSSNLGRFFFIPFKLFFFTKCFSQWFLIIGPLLTFFWLFGVSARNNSTFILFLTLLSLLISVGETIFSFFGKENWVLFLIILFLLPLVFIGLNLLSLFD